MGDAFGPLEIATRTAISELNSLDGINRPLAELAIILSRILDATTGGMAASATARELRETLTQLTEESESGDKLNELLENFSVPVLTTVRDSETA